MKRTMGKSKERKNNERTKRMKRTIGRSKERKNNGRIKGTKETIMGGTKVTKK